MENIEGVLLFKNLNTTILNHKEIELLSIEKGYNHNGHAIEINYISLRANKPSCIMLEYVKIETRNKDYKELKDLILDTK